MKRCSKCGIEKNESEFSKDSSKKDMLNRYCRLCWQAIKMKLRRDNPEVKRKEKEYSKEYWQRPEAKERRKLWEKTKRKRPDNYNKNRYWSDPEKYRQQKRQSAAICYEKNPNGQKKRTAKYKSAHPEHLKQTMKNYYRKNRNLVLLKGKIIAEKKMKNLHSGYIIKKLQEQGYAREQIDILPALLDIKKIQIAKFRINKLLKSKNEQNIYR